MDEAPGRVQSNNSLNSNYFVSHATFLNAVLRDMVEEAYLATKPEASLAYLELTAILAKLLEEAHLLSIVGVDDLRRRNSQVHAFVDKMETISSVIPGWNAPHIPEEKGRSHKRQRSNNFDDGNECSSKRRLDSDWIPTKMATPILDSSLAGSAQPSETFPQRHTTWWIEPFYD